MNAATLASYVRDYQRKDGPGSRLDDYLGYYEDLRRSRKPLKTAIRLAALGKEEITHPHQYRVGREVLEQARKKLQTYSDEIMACKSFDDLLTCVNRHTKSVERFGVLAVYDTSLRIGAYLDLWPQVVYLHAGTKKGCQALGRDTSSGFIELDDLREPIATLEAHHAENFLCAYKDDFSKAGRVPRLNGCESKKPRTKRRGGC